MRRSVVEKSGLELVKMYIITWCRYTSFAKLAAARPLQ